MPREERGALPKRLVDVVTVLAPLPRPRIFVPRRPAPVRDAQRRLHDLNRRQDRRQDAKSLCSHVSRRSQVTELHSRASARMLHPGRSCSCNAPGCSQVKLHEVAFKSTVGS
eukprot:845928-Rhodomonas_salina.2